jgi:hypothetical protein
MVLVLHTHLRPRGTLLMGVRMPRVCLASCMMLHSADDKRLSSVEIKTHKHQQAS